LIFIRIKKREKSRSFHNKIEMRNEVILKNNRKEWNDKINHDYSIQFNKLKIKDKNILEAEKMLQPFVPNCWLNEEPSDSKVNKFIVMKVKKSALSNDSNDLLDGHVAAASSLTDLAESFSYQYNSSTGKSGKAYDSTRVLTGSAGDSTGSSQPETKTSTDDKASHSKKLARKFLNSNDHNLSFRNDDLVYDYYSAEL
jgi:hypothetical protein